MEVKIKQGNEMLDATIEMIDGVMIVTQKEEKFEPKDGDVVFSGCSLISIFKEMSSDTSLASYVALSNGELEKENNTFKDTLIEAVRRGADLGEWGKLQSSSDILIVGAIGSRNGYTTIFHTDKGVFVQCGCFRGSLEEFETKVKETHHGNKHERDYLALIQFAKIKFEL